MLELSIIKEICSAWVDIAKSRNFKEMIGDVPDENDLKVLLETVFLASMKMEEGVRIKVRLVFFPNATTQSLSEYTRWIHALPFANPINLSVQALRKLAPALEQKSTALAVSRSRENYFIVGVLFYGRSISRLESGQGWLGRPNALTLSTSSPGSVTIAYSDSVLGRFEDGRFSIANPGPMVSNLLVTYILKIIKEHQQYQNYQNEYWYLYRDCIERLYLSIANFGHGGTIVYIPTKILEKVSTDIEAGIQIFSQHSGEYLAGLVLGRKATGEDDSVMADYRRRLAEYLDMLARFSCIDGAVVIDDHLVPHRFGAHLASRKWNGKVQEGPVGTSHPGQAIEVSRFGTRHNSAINFAGAHPGTILFVISEDGPVRTICRLDTSVLIWSDCLNTVFLD